MRCMMKKQKKYEPLNGDHFFEEIVCVLIAFVLVAGLVWLALL